MYPTTNRQRAALYFKAVDEIRARLRCIDDLLAGKTAKLLVHEFCHLQLRLSAECFAIACLAAQGDFQTHKAFRDKYEPGQIFKALEASYQSFFPIPSIMQSISSGQWYFDDVGHGNSITRLELERMWNLSGSYLHRGSAKRYLSEPQEVDLLAVTQVKERFWNLLMDHMVILADQKSRLHVHVERDTDHIQCHFLFLDIDAGTARVEPYSVSLK